MAQTESWNTITAHRVGQRVAYFRKRIGAKGITAQALADRCAALGHPLDRTVIAKLEKGLRQSVTVADLLVLSEALGVPPVALVVPIDQDATVEILPGQEVPAYEAMTWFTGERRQLWGGAATGTPDDFALADTYRAHERRVAEWQSQAAAAARAASAIGKEPSAEGQAKLYQQLAAGAEREIRRIRRELRRAGARLPELPAELRHIDDEGDEQ